MRYVYVMIGLFILSVQQLMAQDVSSKTARESVFNTSKINSDEEKTDTLNMKITPNTTSKIQQVSYNNYQENDKDSIPNNKIPLKTEKKFATKPKH